MLGLRGKIDLMAKTGPALLKRKKRFEKCVVTFPERAEFYLTEIAKLDDQLRALHACQRCGRPLKGEESMLRGYGPECARKIGAEEGDEQEGSGSGGLRPDGEGHGGEDPDGGEGLHEAQLR